MVDGLFSWRVNTGMDAQYMDGDMVVSRSADAQCLSADDEGLGAKITAVAVLVLSQPADQVICCVVSRSRSLVGC